MLAYVFWHWPNASVAPEGYERLQRAFQAALAAHPSRGLVTAFTHGVRGAPWANGGGAAYEDWYVVRDSAALDPLNEAAVSASRQAPHDAAAAAAAGGTAGLYSLRLGALDGAPRHGIWFAKPSGMPYRELFRLLVPIVEGAGATLWGRQMTLGPTTEFCLLSRDELALPQVVQALRLTLRPVWPEAKGG